MKAELRTTVGRPRVEKSGALWRTKRSVEGIERQRRRTAAVQRAKTRLAQRHRAEFERLVAEEKARGRVNQ